MDYIVRATAADGQIRAFAATTRETVETARQDHNTSPVATAALGRLLTAGAMMGVMMKGDKDILTLQMKGTGPLGGNTVTADSKGNVKGYVDHPNAILPPNTLISRTSDPKSTIGDEIRNEKVTPSGSPALVNPIKIGIDEQEQNGVTVPRSAPIRFAQIP